MSNITTNLPSTTSSDSAGKTKKFFNNYYSKGIAVPGDSLDAAVAFFESRGFAKSAADSVASALLTQSKIENVDIFQIIDTLKKLNELQLSRVVIEILNYNRSNISTLGTRTVVEDQNNYDIRNIMV